MASKRLRIGLIGVGRRGRSYASTIFAFGDRFELAGLCDPSSTLARAKSDELGVPGYLDVGELVRKERLDAVVVATPPETHHVVARAAAAAGVHMLIESPLATTRAMMAAIEEAAASGGVHVEVGENMFRRPEARLNRLAIDRGLVGRVLRVSSFYEDGGHSSCYHSLSKLQFSAGSDVVRVNAFSQSATLDDSARPPEERRSAVANAAFDLDETWTVAALEFANGVAGTCVYSNSWLTTARRGIPRLVSIEGSGGFITMTGRDSSALRTTSDGAAHDYAMEVERGEGPDADSCLPRRFSYATDPAVVFENPYGDNAVPEDREWPPWDALSRADELASLHDAIVTGAPPEYGTRNAKRDQSLSIAIKESALLAKPMTLAGLPGETAWEREQHETMSAQGIVL
jgi:predicted dehydrogenase